MESFLIQSNLAAAQSAGNLLTSKNGSKTFKVILMTFHNHPTRPSLYTGVTPVYNVSHRESDDSYGKVVLQLAPRWRIIESRNAEQWIIQKRSAEPLDRGKWTGVSYVVSRDKLIALSTSLGLLSETSKRAVLEALPSSATDLRK
jgi:hypothetical protein